MKNNIKITVITVVYNGERFIERTIKSVLSQTYKNIEYIIIDGGSTDNTLNIIKKYSSRINKIVSEKDNGIYDAMNKGIKFSTGRIIYFLNSDDYLYDKNVIKDIIKVFQSKKCMLVYGDVVGYEPRLKKSMREPGKITLEDIKKGKRPCHQGAFATKNMLVKSGYFDLKYKIASDYDFFCKVFKRYGKFILYTNRIIAKYNYSGFSSRYVPRFEDSARIIRKHFGIYSYIKYQKNLIKYVLKLVLLKLGILKYIQKIVHKN